MQRNKRCFKCNNILPLSDFYRHPRMADGYLNKCKECTKKDVKQNYSDRREQYSEYERTRNKDPERKKKMLEYQQSRRKRNPEKYRAWAMVGSALKNGVIERSPCEFCGDPKVQAHHEDYSRPFDVVWVCFKCHREKYHDQIVTSGLER